MIKLKNNNRISQFELKNTLKETLNENDKKDIRLPMIDDNFSPRNTCFNFNMPGV